MNQSSKAELHFSWDTSASSLTHKEKIEKITSETEIDLEPYFAFLEDILPPPRKPEKKSKAVNSPVFKL